MFQIESGIKLPQHHSALRIIFEGVSSTMTTVEIAKHTACISFWIPKRQTISTDTSFAVKMMVKIYAIEIIFKPHEPFQSYLLTGQADSANKAG